jgi:hypothetical protein
MRVDFATGRANVKLFDDYGRRNVDCVEQGIAMWTVA